MYRLRMHHSHQSAQPPYKATYQRMQLHGMRAAVRCAAPLTQERSLQFSELEGDPVLRELNVVQCRCREERGTFKYWIVP